jgi:hypothetical protein
MGLIVTSPTITLHFLARVSVLRIIFSFQSNKGGRTVTSMIVMRIIFSFIDENF